ncbi:uncharacterized protein YaiI (UPF0178 family) [Kutzneria viridogrisea]|uniref:Uncharacterized protein YaiI (UPF0178 family) n=1 Tax=Kutzneria viridogrisea TaxID=47990 RepID=A0ABR6B875_9PSEU|nr:hypothetical protein [Kutzneria albida]MBA8922941.1 uncharacterized protein YaiI (UPF0178 family) [Kutzneria viridogrisea]
MDPLLVIDAANVVGSVPDGWWRDRAAATERLRDRIADLSERGLPETGAPVEVVLVVEGKASRVAGSPTVRVIAAPGEGDDRIVDLVREHAPRRTYVVTADRGLRARVTALGAHVLGPKSIR